MISKLAADNNQGSAFPADQQARTWAVESKWVEESTAGAPGVQTEAEWKPEYALVKKYGDVKELPAIGTMMDPDLVAGLYKDGALVWPGK